MAYWSWNIKPVVWSDAERRSAGTRGPILLWWAPFCQRLSAKSDLCDSSDLDICPLQAWRASPDLLAWSRGHLLLPCKDSTASHKIHKICEWLSCWSYGYACGVLVNYVRSKQTWALVKDWKRAMTPFICYLKSKWCCKDKAVNGVACCWQAMTR